MNYRIEKRNGNTTEYWAQSGSGQFYWNPNKSRAELFTESERQESLMQSLRGDGKGLLPPGGIWVVIDEPDDESKLAELQEIMRETDHLQPIGIDR